MTKILFISYYFPPAGGSGVQRALKFVKYLPAEGFAPTVIAGPVTTQDTWVPRDSSLAASIPSEASVFHVETPPPRPETKLRQRLSRWFGMSAAFRTWWVNSAVDLSLRVAGDAELILCTMSPYESAAAAEELSRRLKIPWVADLRDPWALDETLILPTWAHRRLEMRRMERSLSSAALVIMNTLQAASDVQRLFPGLREKKVTAITNGFDPEDFAAAIVPRTDSKFRIVHSGLMLTSLGMQLQTRNFYRLFGGVEGGVDLLTRSPLYLLKAVATWSEKYPKVLDDLEICFAGNITAEDRRSLKTSGVGRLVRVTGHLPHSESIQLIRTADLLFLPMHNLRDGNRCRSIPGKTFEYMASGRPILSAVPEGDGRDFLSRCGTALLCRPDDVDGMVQQLEKAYNAWKNGCPSPRKNTDFIDSFSRRNLTRGLADSLRSVLEEKPEGVHRRGSVN